MELRFGINARASRDYDAAFRDRAEGMLDALDRALAEDWSGFQLQRTEPETVRGTHATRMDIRLAYKGKRWGTVQLEVAPTEGNAGLEIDRVPAQPLDRVQLVGPDLIACVSVRYQIAQKIHACTEAHPGGRDNDRFRDLIDLRLLRDIVTFNGGSMAAVRDACVEIFDLRAKHAWPPEVTVYPAWTDGFAAMAADIDFHTDDVEVSAAELRAFIAEIDAA
jgi:hypothetical protein